MSGETMIDIEAGRVTLGRARDAFGWDNEFESVQIDVPEFSVGRWNVTNGEFREFVDAGGYRRRDLWSDEAWRWVEKYAVSHPHFWSQREGAWFWRGMFEWIALPDRWPVWVTQSEADAYAKWRGARLMSESEYQHAAYGTPLGEVRPQPWGSAAPSTEHGWYDFAGWDPCEAGAHPAGASAWGVEDLIGNGWEWTSTEFGPLPGFIAMPSYPEYSADFFDQAHIVMKGASPVTPVELIRPTFRNWFRPQYPYVFAKFRLAR
jgi:formylglycine-generating enzyme required for sulfatase activity